MPALEKPVLIVIDYSPQDAEPPLSIAFDHGNGPKCWLSESKVREIDNNGPNPNASYREFNFEGRKFHPYSITALHSSTFEDIRAFTSTCERLYKHIDWS